MQLPSIKDHAVFGNAPIKEAIVNFSILPLGKDVLPSIEASAKNFAAYPIPKPLHLVTIAGSIDVASGQNIQTDSSLVGYQFWTADNSELITCRLDGFSYHKLKPYDRWEAMLPKVISGWEKYCDTVETHLVIRITVRNINLIEIPHASYELADYFRTSPTLPTGTKGSPENYFSRMTLNFPEYNTKCNVTFAMQPLQPNGRSPILFDIEAYRDVQAPLSSAQLSDLLTILNHNKDTVFFGTITKKTRELFA